MSFPMLSLLTVNIGAAARERAGSLLTWLATQPADVLLLTETSAGAGTAYLLDQFRSAGFAVEQMQDELGDRGAAIVSRVPVARSLGPCFAKVSVPGRVAAVLLDTQPAVAVVAVYVPSRDRSATKTERKEAFVRSFLAALEAMSAPIRDALALGGDYNVIARTHRPLHPGFLPFEFGLLEQIEAHGLVDAHERCSPGEQPYSWIGRTGDGYRYDYFHVGRDLAERIRTCTYLHETRDQRLTDHAAVTLTLAVDDVPRLDTRDPSEADPLTLF